MPSCERGDLLLADRADPILFFPKAHQLLSSVQVAAHFHAEVCFKVAFPLRVKRVRCTFDLHMTGNRDTAGLEQTHWTELSISPANLTTKDPALSTNSLEVALPQPVARIAWVASLRPAPYTLENDMVHDAERTLADHMAVIHRPASDEGIEFLY